MRPAWARNEAWHPREVDGAVDVMPEAVKRGKDLRYTALGFSALPPGRRDASYRVVKGRRCQHPSLLLAHEIRLTAQVCLEIVIRCFPDPGGPGDSDWGSPNLLHKMSASRQHRISYIRDFFQP